VVDRKNHHTFQPLLYQVALAVLSPAEIASPVRTVLRHAANTEVLLGEVTGFDLQQRLVRLDDLGPALRLPDRGRWGHPCLFWPSGMGGICPRI